MVEFSNSSNQEINEILRRLLTRQIVQPVNPIVVISTRKMDLGNVPNTEILRLRDLPLSVTRPIYVLNYLNRKVDFPSTARDYLIHLSTFTRQGRPAYLELTESSPTKVLDATNLIEDVYKYKMRYVLEYPSSVRRSDQGHTLIIGYGGMPSNPLKFTVKNSDQIPDWIYLLILGTGIGLYGVGLIISGWRYLNNSTHTYP